jgi:hypothetical protein
MKGGYNMDPTETEMKVCPVFIWPRIKMNGELL